MAGTGGASSMAESDGSCNSENRNKRNKSGNEGEGEDRLSALPDSLIEHILSLLPATDLVKTCVLSKWWKYQWTRVPVLNFIPSEFDNILKFSNFIDKTLIHHDCPNIDKFVVAFQVSSSPASRSPNLDPWIHFAVSKNVKELVLEVDELYYLLPQFLFDSSSIVNLKLSSCYFMPTGTVNWGSLNSLCLHWCEMEDEYAIENVTSGCPLLEYFELCNCQMFNGFFIACKSLKTLILDGVNCQWNAIDISCPNLGRLSITGPLWFTGLKLINLQSSVYAALDFYSETDEFEEYISDDDCVDLVRQSLLQVQHVEKLEIGRWLMEILLSSMEDGGCIGGLPDPVIHRIISFLPSTKEAIKTGLYKPWQREWTDVSILEFVSNEKLVIDSKDIALAYLAPRLSLWIRYAAKKDVKELILDCDGANVESGHEYPLPQYLFNNFSLVKMMICSCRFMPNGKVNWQSLKSLDLDYSELGTQAIEHVLSGSPLLEWLGLRYCGFEGAVVVASEHLKTLILEDFGKTCPLLEISCPNLQSLKIWGDLGHTSLKLTNLPSSLHATLDFYILESDGISPDECINLLEDFTEQILHIEKLDIELTRLKSSDSSIGSRR